MDSDSLKILNLYIVSGVHINEIYVGCLESIHPFLISRELVVWPGCNLATCQTKPYCTSLNSHTPKVYSVGSETLLIIYAMWPLLSQWPREQIGFIVTMPLSILWVSCGLLWQRITSPKSVSPLQHRFGSLRLLALSKAKITVEREEICECNRHTAHMLSHRHLTADIRAPWESVCSWIRS